MGEMLYAVVAFAAGVAVENRLGLTDVLKGFLHPADRDAELKELQKRWYRKQLDSLPKEGAD